jgi:hypothetical protein
MYILLLSERRPAIAVPHRSHPQPRPFESGQAQLRSARRQHSIALDKQALTDQFKTLANEILEEKSKR